MTTALEASTKRSYAMLRLIYGTPAAVVGYTNFNEDVTDEGVLHLSKPDMEVQLPENSGTFRESKATVRMPADDLTRSLSSGEPFSVVKGVITEFSSAAEGNYSAERLTLFSGLLHSAVRNKSNRNDTVLLRFDTLKERLAGSAGIPANHHCAHPFTGTGCFYDATIQIQVGTITAITQKGATITGIAAPAAPGGSFAESMYRKGYIERDGIRVLIRDWDSSDVTNFSLKRRPPASWLNQTVIVHPGCSKEIEVCRGRWDNEEHFGGYGFAIPAYFPVFETQ